MGGGQPAERERGELLMTDYLVTDTDLTSVADAIRYNTGGTDPLEFPAEFISEIEKFPPIWYDLPCGFIIGSAKGTTYTVLGSDSSLPVTRDVFPHYLYCSNGVFTVYQAGTYTLKCYARGSYTSSGTAVSCWFKVYKNNEVVYSYTSGSTYNNAGGIFPVVLGDLNVGDTFKIEVRSSTGSTTSVTFGCGIMVSIN